MISRLKKRSDPIFHVRIVMRILILPLFVRILKRNILANPESLQFDASVERVDYLTLRHGFVMAHLAPQQEKKFDFQLYINRALEEDFTDVVGIRLVFILLATIHTLNCTITMEPVTLTSQPMDNNVTNAIFALLGSISQDLAMINERLERRVGQREQVGCPETRQEEGRSSYVILPKVEALKSFFCDTLGIVRSHEKKTLVVGTQALVDPLDNEIAFSRENDLCPSSASTYNLTKRRWCVLRIPSTSSSCASYVGPTLSGDFETSSKCMHENPIFEIDLWNTFLNPLFVHDIFKDDRESMPNCEDGSLGESENDRNLGL
ncbi:hypothetical protein T459_30153 [Capsicum annuum]|uniref:Uncharacterized protein n=1 Tax=Capsicum annuum TaxID=4072 RepID=A0A2G2Y7K7_CAPAN|nr:hypothetical protein T459_30153 [Capsicum annuum]